MKHVFTSRSRLAASRLVSSSSSSVSTSAAASASASRQQRAFATFNKSPSSVSALSSSSPSSSSSSSTSLPHGWKYLLGFATAVGASYATCTQLMAAPAKEGKDNKQKKPAFDEVTGLNDEGIFLQKLLKPSTGKPLVVLVACGSYSPITNMHLLVFEQARNYLMLEKDRYDVIGGFLSPVHDAYGKASLIPMQQRYEMCIAAVANNPWLSVQQWEMKQKGWTTTAETLCKYQEALNTSELTQDPIRVKMLCGADLLESTLVPNLWSKEDLDLIFGTIGVVVIERVGLDLVQVIESSDVLRKYRTNIDIVPQRITNSISSTSVRHLIKHQQSIKFLTPDPVIEYIYKNSLYGHDPSKHPQKYEYLQPRF